MKDWKAIAEKRAEIIQHYQKEIERTAVYLHVHNMSCSIATSQKAEELRKELSALESQEVEGVQPKVRNILQDFRRRNDYPLTKAVPDMLNLLSKLGKQPEYEPQSAKEFVNNKLGDKNYTHSPFTIYREEMAKWLEQYHNNKQL